MTHYPLVWYIEERKIIENYLVPSSFHCCWYDSWWACGSCSDMSDLFDTRRAEGTMFSSNFFPCFSQSPIHSVAYYQAHREELEKIALEDAGEQHCRVEEELAGWCKVGYRRVVYKPLTWCLVGRCRKWWISRLCWVARFRVWLRLYFHDHGRRVW